MVGSDAPRASTYETSAARLLGGEPTLTTHDVVAQTPLTLADVRAYWRSLGFADLDDDTPHFTPQDVEILSELVDLVHSGVLSADTTQTLVRAAGHSGDRLALWQLEAMVEDAIDRFDLDDISARLVVLDRLTDLAPTLERLVRHVWRRQLAALLGRVDREVGTSHRDGSADPGQLPLERAVGFIDMKSFTERSAGLSSANLARLVGGFETAARDTIASYGARVVKTIGDAVLFVADDLGTAAQVALRLVQEMDGAGFEIRGSLVWGRVLSRSGDIFGPSVNLASRLGDIAPDGCIVLDNVSAVLLQAVDPAFELVELDAVAVQGLGVVRPFTLTRPVVADDATAGSGPGS